MIISTYNIPNPSLSFSSRVNVKKEITVTEYNCNKPLQNLEIFLKKARIQTKNLFNSIKPIYTSIDIDTEIYFNSESFMEEFEKSSIETKNIFTEDLFNYIQKLYNN